MDKHFEINCWSSYISYINTHLETNIALKTGFLSIFFWRFIEVKQTISTRTKATKICIPLTTMNSR